MGRLGREGTAKELGEESAFPLQFHAGLTKREWFTGMALAGLLANPVNNGVAKDYAEDAKMHADEVLKALIIFPEPGL